MLVEAGMLLVQNSKSNKCVPGVVTPAVAFGGEIVSRLESTIGVCVRERQTERCEIASRLEFTMGVCGREGDRKREI